LVLELHRLISQSSVAIGHNVDRFDDRRANTDFIKHNLPPPPPHKTIDTLKVAKKYFDFNSNKLDSLGEFLGVGRKVKHSGFEMWERCLEGDQDAWDSMKRYNAQDVALLERVYLKLRPWMQGHPDLNAPDGHIGCPACRGTSLQRRGWSIASHGRSPRFQCRDCGKWSKGKPIKDQMHYR
jgi:hypothetical protein